MKITIYDLLVLIKEGKEPKKIKFKNELYECFNELREENVIEIVNILDIKKDIEKKRGGINECI